MFYLSPKVLQLLRLQDVAKEVSLILVN